MGLEVLVPRLLSTEDGEEVYGQLVRGFVKSTRGDSRLALEHWATAFAHGCGGTLIVQNPSKRNGREYPECHWYSEGLPSLLAQMRHAS